jgi:hypothetical protein
VDAASGEHAEAERLARDAVALGQSTDALNIQGDTRRLAEAIWHMLTRNQPFAPKSATDPLAA